jgi:aryl-alcohol dehydrogenase-like predicted oxidoreductase
LLQRLFYIATKVGFKPEGFDYRSDSVQRSLENSLELLGLDQLTVAQIHEVNLGRLAAYH